MKKNFILTIFMLNTFLLKAQIIHLGEGVEYIDFYKIENVINYFNSQPNVPLEEVVHVKSAVTNSEDSIRILFGKDSKVLKLYKLRLDEDKNELVFKVNEMFFRSSLKDFLQVSMVDVQMNYFRDIEHEFIVVKMPQTASLNYNCHYFILNLINGKSLHYVSLPMNNYFLLKRKGMVLFPKYAEKIIYLYDKKLKYGRITLHPYEQKSGTSPQD